MSKEEVVDVCAWAESSHASVPCRDDSSQDDAVPPSIAMDALTPAYKPTRRGGKRFRQRKCNALSKLETLVQQGEAESTAMASISTGLRLRLPGGRERHRENGRSVERRTGDAGDREKAKTASASAAHFVGPHPLCTAAPRSRSAPCTPAQLVQLQCENGSARGCVFIKNTFIHVAVGSDSSEADQNEKPSHCDVATAAASCGVATARRRERSHAAQAHVATDSDTSIENLSCPSTDWEYPIHPLIIMQPMMITFVAVPEPLADAGTGGTADVAAPDAATCSQTFAPDGQEQAEDLARPDVTSVGDEVELSKVAGKIESGESKVACMPECQPIMQDMESHDVLDAFDAFNGSEWLSYPAAQPPKLLNLRDEFPVSNLLDNKARSVSPVYSLVTGRPFASYNLKGATERHRSCPSFAKPWLWSTAVKELADEIAAIEAREASSKTEVVTTLLEPQKQVHKAVDASNVRSARSPERKESLASKPKCKSFVGKHVRLQGLTKKPEFNGALGIVEAYDEESRRYNVRVTLLATATNGAPTARPSEMRAKLRREHFVDASEEPAYWADLLMTYSAPQTQDSKTRLSSKDVPREAQTLGAGKAGNRRASRSESKRVVPPQEAESVRKADNTAGGKASARGTAAAGKASRSSAPSSVAPALAVKTNVVLMSGMSDGGTGSCVDLVSLETGVAVQPQTVSDGSAAQECGTAQKGGGKKSGNWRPSLRQIGS